MVGLELELELKVVLKVVMFMAANDFHKATWDKAHPISPGVNCFVMGGCTCFFFSALRMVQCIA